MVYLNGMMDGCGGLGMMSGLWWPMMLLAVLFWIALLVALILLIVWLYQKVKKEFKPTKKKIRK